VDLSSQAGAPSRASPRAWLSLILAGAVAVTLSGALLWHRVHAPTARDVPVLWRLPAWRLTNQDGVAFGASELRGRVYIADFVFTSCVMECPRLTRQMAHLQPMVRQLGPDRVRLVSFSVDPTNDTPPRLRAYMAQHRADPGLWTFVTGPADDVMRAVTEGFRVGVQDAPRAADGTFNPIELAHSNRFALVDRHGRLRGLYEADDTGTQELTAALTTVLREP
jgi:protein SCO1/2